MTPGALDSEHEARQRIRQVLELYFSSLDGRRFDDLQACFTDDCHAEYGLDMHGTGAADLAGPLAVAQHCRVVERYRATIHSIANTAVSVAHGGEAASAISHVIATLATDSGVQAGELYVRGLRYSDELVNCEGLWRISSRRHEVLWQYRTTLEAPGLPPLLERAAQESPPGARFD
jgi:SnoaL-like domain